MAVSAIFVEQNRDQVTVRESFETALIRSGLPDLVDWSRTLIPPGSSSERDYLKILMNHQNLWAWVGELLDQTKIKHNFFRGVERPVVGDFVFSGLVKKIGQETLSGASVALSDKTSLLETVEDMYYLGLSSLNKIFWMLRGARENKNATELIGQAEKQSPDSLTFQANHLEVLKLNANEMRTASLAIRLEYLLRGLFNQWIELVDPQVAREQLKLFYKFITAEDGVDVYGAGSHNYTNTHIVEDVLTRKLLELQLSPDTRAFVAGIGNGSGPDLRALQKVITSPIDGVDIIEQPPITGVNFTHTDLLNFEPPETPYKLIACTGSSLLNQRALTDHLLYWQKFNELLGDDGILLYEAVAMDTKEASNYLFNMALQFNRIHPTSMFGAIGRREAYRRPGETNDSFGANVLPDPITRLLAELAGLKCEAVDKYQTGEKAYGALYTFRKVDRPHPLLAVILSTFPPSLARDPSQDASAPA